MKQKDSIPPEKFQMKIPFSKFFIKSQTHKEEWTHSFSTWKIPAANQSFISIPSSIILWSPWGSALKCSFVVLCCSSESSNLSSGIRWWFFHFIFARSLPFPSNSNQLIIVHNKCCFIIFVQSFLFYVSLVSWWILDNSLNEQKKNQQNEIEKKSKNYIKSTT